MCVCVVCSKKDWFCRGYVCCMEVRKIGFVEVWHVLYGMGKIGSVENVCVVWK